VADDKDFRERVQRIGTLVEEIEAIADPAVRATTKVLVQSLMDLHGAAIERMMEIVSEAGDPGMALIDRLGQDPMVSSVLVLYGLHPEDLDSRVSKAIEKVRPQLRKQGAELEVLELHEGVVRIRVDVGEHTCGSTAKSVRTTLEGAVYDAAPDLNLLTLEGLDGKAASGFVALGQLTGIASVAVPKVPLSAEGAD
jgi:Fe-S cluster biogenesis protein NfuA